MAVYAAPWLLLYAMGVAGSLSLRGVARSVLTWALPLAGLVLLFVQRDADPVWRLFCASALFLFLMKSAVLAVEPASSHERLRWPALLAFFTVWPGMNPAELADRGSPQETSSLHFNRGLIAMILGSAGSLALALGQPWIGPEATGWLGIACLLLIIHLGFAGILSGLMQLIGWRVRPLFDRPLASRTLREFWTDRWNRPFVDMDRRLFMRPLTRLWGLKGAVLAVFLISGLLHEMAISYPAGSGWGGPLLYFVIQGAAFLVEKRLNIRSRLATWLVILLPLPMLFHSAFRETFIVPLFEFLHLMLTAQDLDWYLDILLWVLGGAQLLVLIASFQVPSRLRWRDELRSLSPFNRKLMWTLGGFTTMTISAFGVLTLSLHRSFLVGEPAAIGLAIYITLFWVGRLLIDATYYRREDWPVGPQFRIGHMLLNCLFLFLAFGYSSVVLYHALY